MAAIRGYAPRTSLRQRVRLLLLYMTIKIDSTSHNTGLHFWFSSAGWESNPLHETMPFFIYLIYISGNWSTMSGSNRLIHLGRVTHSRYANGALKIWHGRWVTLPHWAVLETAALLVCHVHIINWWSSRELNPKFNVRNVVWYSVSPPDRKW